MCGCGGFASEGSGPGTVTPGWVKFSVTHTQLQAAALTNDIEIYSGPTRFVLSAAVLKHTTLFAGAGITDYKLSLGLAGDVQRYMVYFDVDTAVADTNFGSSLVIPQEIGSFGAATSVRVAAKSIGANLNTSTAGAADIWLLLSRLPA